VLNMKVDGGSPKQTADVCVFPKASDVLRLSREKGYMNFVVTNQPDWVLGNITSLATLYSIHDRVLDELNGLIDDFRICIHHPEARFPQYRKCDCRKPKPGMILSLAEEHGIELSESIMIGDREKDVEAGINAGVGLTIKIDPNLKDTKADVIVRSLGELEKLWQRV